MFRDGGEVDCVSSRLDRVNAHPHGGIPMPARTMPTENVLPKPKDVDPGWATKIAKAKEAREQGRKAREGRSPVAPTSRLAGAHPEHARD